MVRRNHVYFMGGWSWGNSRKATVSAAASGTSVKISIPTHPAKLIRGQLDTSWRSSTLLYGATHSEQNKVRDACNFAENLRECRRMMQAVLVHLRTTVYAPPPKRLRSVSSGTGNGLK
jgi:hypothetical protein